MDEEHQQEVEVLKSNLCQIREKFLIEWTGGTYQKLLATKKQQASESVKQAQENSKGLEDSIRNDRSQLSKLDRGNSENEKEISSIERDLEMLSLQTEQLSKKKELREKQLDDAKNFNKQEQQGVQQARQKTALKMNQFTKGIQFFEEHLGFNFKKIGDEHLQFVFKYIDPNDQDAAFTFTVKVDDSGTYNIKDCSPMIGQLDALTDELNKTNDFSKFVIGVRRGFKKLVAKSNK